MSTERSFDRAPVLESAGEPAQEESSSKASGLRERTEQLVGHSRQLAASSRQLAAEARQLAANIQRLAAQATVRSAGEITTQSLSRWLHLVPCVTGYGVSITDANRRVVWANDSFTRLTQYEAHEILGRKISELLYFESTDSAIVSQIRTHLEAARGARFELLVRGKKGREFWLDADCQPLRDASGELQGWVSVLADITAEVAEREALRRAEAERRIAGERLELIAANVPGMIFQSRHAPNGTREFLYVSSGVRELFGIEPEVVLRNSAAIFEATHPEDRERLMSSMLAAEETLGRWRFEHRVVKRDGTVVWVQGNALPKRAEDGCTLWNGYVSDVTAAKQSEQRISFLAFHDPLTGLENRLGLRNRLDELLRSAARSGSRLAVVLIDLDRFKYVNDTLGHDIGDELLIEIARRLQREVHEADAIARLGGDEFVLVLGGLAGQASVETAVSTLMKRVRGSFRLAWRTVYTTCSIGVSLYPRDGTDATTLLKHADLAMYAAKERGGDSYRFFDQTLRPGTDRLALEMELRDALERGQLEVHYQPRMDTVTGRPIALEALARWRHPVRGLTLAGAFIPVAEETGLIDAIGQWVLEQACRDARAWLDQGGEPLKLGVNLSPVQFAREDLTERVAAALAAARLPPEMLELEITETAAMRFPELAARHLGALRALGVRLALDDFGTGHSSLSRIKLLNVDCVKIDRSLVKDCTESAHGAALCRAAIALGLALGLEVVAEGVETQEQRQFLAQEHCSTIQGFLLARPMPARDAFALVRSLLELPRIKGTGRG
ncbi:MAG TPA: EAL domain-containing protein [Steroidobacteraceae bacterium]|nr:EAL domain-containing protein [Steroidobacteraceae bacterium]